MTWNTPRASKPCVTCGKNLAGHTRDIQAGHASAHPFITKEDRKKPKK